MTVDSPAITTTRALAASYRRRRCLHEADALDGTIAEYDQLRRDIERLRARTHEIQAQEMTKRAELDSEVAKWRQRYETARQWTEDVGLTADWAPQSYHPFWSMTSYNMRSTLLRLVTERDEARAQLTELRRTGCYPAPSMASAICLGGGAS